MHEFATKYFDLPSNHTAALEDAAAFAQRTATNDTQRYDYIIHDVFTGGSEPLSLFTTEFLGKLRDLLAPEGSIAIVGCVAPSGTSTALTGSQNYGGDLTLPPARIVLRTIRSVFSNCRVFRELPPAEEQDETDFVNAIVFCTKAVKPWGFRRPGEADFQNSNSRRKYLLPSMEVPFSQFEDSSKDGMEVLRSQDIGELKDSQVQGALRHWKIMRSVLPAVVWELW